MSKNIEINIQTTANTYETLYPKTLGSLIDGAVSLATNATNATSATSASQATKLSTARTIRTNLSSTSTASFDGTSNITPGITGTLSVSYGGTGVTSYSSLANQLSSYISSSGDTVSVKQYTSTGSPPTIYFPSITGKTLSALLWFPMESPIGYNGNNLVYIGYTMFSETKLSILYENGTVFWNFTKSGNTITFKTSNSYSWVYAPGYSFTFIGFYN